MQQFFIKNIEDLTLDAEQKRQCKQVLRMRAGDEIRIVDEKGRGVVASFVDDSLQELRVINSIKFPPKQHRTILVMAQIRTKPLEWLLQKATELGVDEIYLYPAEHGVVTGYGSKEKRKLERFQEIVKEASEQSYRQYVPQVHIVSSIHEIFSISSDQKLVADVYDHPFILNKLSPKDETIQIVVGPEGGFSDHERTLFKDKQYEFVSLSPQVLRAETAGMIAVQLGEMRGYHVLAR